jgi:undecaprenyl-diphosphatase
MKLSPPQGRKGKVLIAVAIVAALAAFTILLPKLGDSAQHLIESLANSLGKWAYLLVGFLAMAETAAALGFIAPGEFAVIIGGVLAGEGTLNIVLLIGIVWVAIVIGDTIGFFIGHKLGRSFVDRHSDRFPRTAGHFSRVEQFFRDHGGKSIFLGRWIGFARPLMPFTAGTSGMSYRRFLPYDILGAGTWGTTFCLLGYIFWRNFSDVTRLAGRGALALGILVIAIVFGVRAVRTLRDPEQRAKWKAWIELQAERPLLRPFASVARWLWRVVLHPLWVIVGPPLRFTWKRLTPGELGIELTTLVAIAAVASYTIFLQINLLDHETLLAGDQAALDIARDIQNGFLTALARSVTLFGSTAAIVLVVAGTAGFLLARKRRVEAIMLISAAIITEISVQAIKHGVGRARPDDAIVHAGGLGYPSGHAALSITYLAIGVLFARSAQRAGTRIAWIVGGILAAVAIGLSRSYLRVHYLSDVGGGWATGLTVFSLCGAVALIVDYLLRPDLKQAPRGSVG